MKPLIVLLVAFILSLVAHKVLSEHWNIIFAGNAAMSAMLLFYFAGTFFISQRNDDDDPRFYSFQKNTGLPSPVFSRSLRLTGCLFFLQDILQL
ncbi:MAG: hypothetical protein WDO16_08110 [Bacteroidota bacterium]